MRGRALLIRRVVGLAMAGVTAAGCVAGVPEASAPRPPVVLSTPATPSTSTRGSGGSPAPGQPTQGITGEFARIEGADLLIRAARDTAPAVEFEALRALATANADFALDVYRELAADREANVVIGPHSISTALSMIYAGARGETAAEMAEVLHFDALSGDVSHAFNALDLALASRSEEGVVDLRLANQAFAAPDLGLIDSYLATLSRDFGAPLAELDFLDAERARKVINDWASDRTDGRITELFPQGTITPITVLVVVNAVSLDAAWRYLFDPAHTTFEPFHLPDGTDTTLPTMHFDLYLPLVETDEYAAVELPYGTGELSMVTILPADMSTFEETVDADRLQQIFDAIKEQGIHLSLPKFRFKAHTELDDILQQLGMTSVYGPSADLSGMTGTPGLFLDTVQHEAFIEVDEEGTEAHAATGGGVAASHGPTITFDRPFLFVIRDRATGAILFLGRVSDPRG